MEPDVFPQGAWLSVEAYTWTTNDQMYGVVESGALDFRDDKTEDVYDDT